MASAQPGAQALAVIGGGLMLPPPPRPPKRKVTVLEEDEYTGILEAIIERDFFPELPKLESKIAWLQAVRSGDPEQIRQAQLMIAQRRAAAGGRPMTGATPAGAPLFTPGGTAARAINGDTPYISVLPPGVPLSQPRPTTGGGGEAEEAEAEEEAGVRVAPPVPLDKFLAVHTSEDNASFQEILEGVNKRRRQRAAAQLAPQPEPKLLITDGRERTDGFGSTGQQPDTLVLWRYEPKNVLYYDSATREAVPYSGAELAAMVQGAPKGINHGATRFPRDLTASASATPSTSSASGSVVGGCAATAAAAAAGAVGRGGAGGAGGGGTRGYNVLSTPSFNPGVEDTPIMTWGDINATPMRIEAEDLPPGPFVDGPSFYIKEASHKDQAGHVLATKAGFSLRRKQGSLRGGIPLVTGAIAAAAASRRQVTGTSARPPTTGQVQRQQRGGGKPLSAAAQRLASSLHKGRQPDADFGLRASYSGATPDRHRSSTGTRPASCMRGSTWSTHPTPSRAATPAGMPSVHATLEEEELRVQAVLRQRQKEAQQRKELEAAREAAKEGLAGRATQQQEQEQQMAPQAAGGGGGGQGASAAASADLTAGLLNI